MLQHYVRMALRGFVRHKLYSFINVAGLSIALACAILILLFVRDQLSYDDWIPGTANLYRLEVTWHMPGQLMATALSPFPVVNAVKAEIPGVRAVTHLVPEQLTVTVGGRQFLQTVSVVDPNFLQVIRLPLAAGDPARVLAAPESIVLSQSMARKYFGGADPVGQLLQVSGVVPYECSPNDSRCFSATHSLRVSGVLRDLPHNTQLIADFLMPNTSRADELSPAQKQNTWTGTLGNNGYVELAPGIDPVNVLSHLRPILDRSVDLGSSHLTIVGVLNDAMSEDLRSAVWPVIYMVDSDDYNSLSVRVSGDRLAAALAFIDSTWRSFAPGAAMQRYLMSDVFDGLFTSDEKQGTMFVVFVTIAILIACLGLFGLVVFTSERRTKEVGIRKISGARTTDIVTLMLWRISVPVLAANLIAWPVAYYYLHRWRERYPYRISLSPWYFVAAGAAALLIAWATIWVNTWRLARASPVRALRCE